MLWTEKIYPSVNKRWLVFIAGIMWSIVGILLCRLAFIWLKPVELVTSILLAAFGVVLALFIFTLGFSRFANNNIQRIGNYPKVKVCIFAFQQWTSYPLVLVMVSMGIFFRQYSPIPKHYLAVLYIAIGGSLFLGSLLYYKHLTTPAGVKAAQ